jgi:hypothetical protein
LLAPRALEAQMAALVRGTAASCAGTVGWIVVIASVPIQHFVLSARLATALSCFTLGACPNAPGVRRPVIPPRMPRSPTLTPRAPPVISSSWIGIPNADWSLVLPGSFGRSLLTRLIADPLCPFKTARILSFAHGSRTSRRTDAVPHGPPSEQYSMSPR